MDKIHKLQSLMDFYPVRIYGRLFAEISVLPTSVGTTSAIKWCSCRNSYVVSTLLGSAEIPEKRR